MFTVSHLNFDQILPRAFVSLRKNHGQVHRLMHGGALCFRHSYHVLLQHILPILLKKRVAAAHRGQRFQVQKMGARSDAPKYPRTLLTHREEDNRVWRGKDAGKGAIVIFRRLAGGDEDELLALRVLVHLLPCTARR